MKEQENKSDTAVATQELPIAMQNKVGGNDQPSSNAQWVFIGQTKRDLGVSLVGKVRSHTRDSTANIVPSQTEKDGSKGNNAFVYFVRGAARVDIVSSQSMAKIENVAMDAVMSDDVIGRIAEEVARCDQSMKQIAVFVPDQFYHHVQVSFPEKRSFHSRERLSTREFGHVPSRQGPRGEGKDDTDSTADSCGTDENRQDRPSGLTRKGKNGHHSDSWTDDEQLPSDQSEQSKDDIDSRVMEIFPVDSLFRNALIYCIYSLSAGIKRIPKELRSPSLRCKRDKEIAGPNERRSL